MDVAINLWPVLWLAIGVVMGFCAHKIVGDYDRYIHPTDVYASYATHNVAPDSRMRESEFASDIHTTHNQSYCPSTGHIKSS